MDKVPPPASPGGRSQQVHGTTVGWASELTAAEAQVASAPTRCKARKLLEEVMQAVAATDDTIAKVPRPCECQHRTQRPRGETICAGCGVWSALDVFMGALAF